MYIEFLSPYKTIGSPFSHSAQSEKSQEALFNVLMAYSALDPDVGYCQGMAYVTAVFLMHVGVDHEDEAFTLLTYVMFGA